MAMTNAIVRPGQMRHVLYLQRQIDDHGNASHWTNVESDPAVRCAMTHLRGSEPESSSGERGENLIELELRYRADVTYDKRFSDGAGRAFHIISIVNVGELNRKLIVQVKEHRRVP